MIKTFLISYSQPYKSGNNSTNRQTDNSNSDLKIIFGKKNFTKNNVYLLFFDNYLLILPRNLKIR